MIRQGIGDSALEKVIRGHQTLEASLHARRAIEDSIMGSTARIERAMALERAMTKRLARAVLGDAGTAAQMAMNRYAASSTAALGALERAALDHSVRFTSAWLSQERLASGVLKRIQLEGSLAALRTAQITGVVGDLKRFSGATDGIARMLGEIESRTLSALKPSLALDRSWASVREMASLADITWMRYLTDPTRLAGLSPGLARAPALEIYSAARSSALLATADDATDFETVKEVELEIAQISDGFEARLGNFDIALLRMYKGGSERINHGGADWQRHALISFRELATHTLHKLAPDEKVRPWAKPVHLSEGKLTRKARLEFIFREDNNGDLVPFMKKDFAAALELFELLNKAHKKELAISQKQFRILRNRIEGLLNTLLEAAGY